MLAGGLTVKQVAAWMTKDGHAAEVIATFEDSIDPEAAELCVVRNIDSLPPRQQLAYHVMVSDVPTTSMQQLTGCPMVLMLAQVKFGLPLDEVVMVLQKLTGQRAMKPPTSIDALQTRIDSIGGATSAAWQEALASRRESCVAQAVTADDAAAADDAAEPAAVAADTSATDDSNDDNNDAGAAAVPP